MFTAGPDSKSIVEIDQNEISSFPEQEIGAKTGRLNLNAPLVVHVWEVSIEKLLF
jgi:hypothetical protein